MAWTDQCKVAFKVNADGLLWRQEKQTKKGIMKILAQLSEDSGIPQKTLWRWWDEEERRKEKNLKNETNRESDTTTEDDSTNSESVMEQDQQKSYRPICNRCNKNPVQLHGNTKKPYSKKSKYYGLCGVCRQKQHAILILDENATKDNGIPTICPKCHHAFYINKERTNGG